MHLLCKKETMVIKAVIFDMYETLITHYESSVYFGTQMAFDAGIEQEKFQAIWRVTESDRTIGKISFEEILEKILKENNCFSDEKMSYIVNKRIFCQEELFEHINEEIIPMLKNLKEKGIRIGLISNCFSEEAIVIKKSKLYSFFDAVCLSYDEGLQKPDLEIFQRCLKKLNVQADECIYVGDGGSNELVAAKSIGMKSMQAVWYLKANTNQPSKRNPLFIQLETPTELMKYLW